MVSSYLGTLSGRIFNHGTVVEELDVTRGTEAEVQEDVLGWGCCGLVECEPSPPRGCRGMLPWRNFKLFVPGDAFQAILGQS